MRTAAPLILLVGASPCGCEAPGPGTSSSSQPAVPRAAATASRTLAAPDADVSPSATPAGTPSEAECAELSRRFAAGLPSGLLPEPDWIAARCRVAGAGVLRCIDPCDSSAATQACLWLSARGCVQQHATRRAVRRGIERALVGVMAAGAKPDSRGWVKLPGKLTLLSLDGRMWVDRGPDQRRRMFLKTWEGRQANVGGYLFSSVPFSAEELVTAPAPMDPGHPVETVRVDDFPLESASGELTVGATFTVVEREGDRWLRVVWNLD